MQRFLVVVGIFVGLLSIVKSKTVISEDDIDILIEKKLETVMKKYDRKIALLEDKIHSQEKKIKIFEEKCSGHLMGGAEEEKGESMHLNAASNHSAVTSLQKNPELKRSTIFDAKKRVVPGATEIVAFCAYMTISEVNPSLHHVFVFDNVQTNIGSAYNKYSGTFTAPTNGVYVFTWTLFTNGNSYAFSQIVVNSQAFTSLITDSEEISDIHSSTGVIVVSLNREDLVFIRTHPTILSSGTILSVDTHGQPSFSGWKL